MQPSQFSYEPGAKLGLDSSIDVTPSVLLRIRSLAQIASSLAYKQDNVLALLYIALGWTESGRMISHRRREICVDRKCQPRKHSLNACLNAWKTEATIVPDPGLIQAMSMNHGLEGENRISLG